MTEKKAFLIKRKSSANWSIRYGSNGKTISTKTPNRQKAERQLAIVNSLIEQTISEDLAFTLLSATNKAGSMTKPILHHHISELWGEWERQSQIEIGSRLWKDRRNKVRKFNDWIESEHPEVQYIKDVSPQMANDFLQSIISTANTRNKHLSTLSSTFKTLMIPLKLKENPFQYCIRGKSVVISKQDLTLDQISKMIEQAKTYTPKCGSRFFWQIAICLGYYTGLRRGDICSLKWDNFDWENNILTIQPSKTKESSGKTVAFPINEQYGKLIKQVKKGKSEYIFPSVKKSSDAKTRKLDEDFDAICSAAGIQTHREPENAREKKRKSHKIRIIGFHSLRHTFCTIMDQAGANLDDIMNTAGHSNKTTTMLYNHSIEAGKRIAALQPPLKFKSE